MAGSDMKRNTSFYQPPIPSPIDIDAQKKEEYADVNGTRIFYKIEGKGHPLVLIHGFSLDTRMWADQILTFSKRYRIIRYDRRGFGKSGVNQTGFTEVEDLYELLRHLGVRSCYVLGMSQGGGIARDLTLDHPEMVDALILQDTSVKGFRWPRNPHIPRVSLREMALTEGLEKAKKAWLNNPRFRISRQKPRVYRRLKQIIAEWSGSTWLNPPTKQNEASETKQPIDRLGEIKIPTLVILGEHESIALHCAANALVFGIPNSEKALVSGAGHMANMDEPLIFNKIVLSFLEKVDRSLSEKKKTKNLTS
jgi:pimeloyl-ACP methyl ester carboxylesterase